MQKFLDSLQIFLQEKEEKMEQSIESWSKAIAEDRKENGPLSKRWINDMKKGKQWMKEVSKPPLWMMTRGKYLQTYHMCAGQKLNIIFNDVILKMIGS
jgi:hypothetical protein